MYDSTTGTTMLAVTGSGLGVGLTVGSWLLIAVAVVALGSTLIALGRRYQKRNGAKP